MYMFFLYGHWSMAVDLLMCTKSSNFAQYGNNN